VVLFPDNVILRGKIIFLWLGPPMSLVEELHHLKPDDAQESGCEADDNINGVKEGEVKEVPEKGDVQDAAQACCGAGSYPPERGVGSGKR